MIDPADGDPVQQIPRTAPLSEVIDVPRAAGRARFAEDSEHAMAVADAQGVGPGT